MKLVITGGGTGGHIFGGIAIAQEFLGSNQTNEVLFIGSSFGLETKLIPKAGFRLETIPIGKLVGQSMLTRIITLLRLPGAIIRCWRLLRKFQADFVIGVGGYAAGPCIVSARLLGLPVGVLEQNSVAGFTNQLCARFARHVFTAFDEPPRGIDPRKCIVTGNPTRSELRLSSHASPSKPFVVFAFGGSQGAHGINKLLVEAAPIWTKSGKKIEIIHQTGPQDLEWVQSAYKEYGFKAEVHAFIDNMQLMYDRCSIVICRAGSSTISELATTGNAAIFIPFPKAAGNHQEINARILERAGAAKVLLQDQATPQDLVHTIDLLMEDPNRLQEMRQKMQSFHRPNAARQILGVMLELTHTAQERR